MIDGSINTYFYDVITSSEVTVNFNHIIDYVTEQLLTTGSTNVTLFDVYNYCEDNFEEVILNTAHCFDFIEADNIYTLEDILSDFKIYLENRFGVNWKNEKL